MYKPLKHFFAVNDIFLALCAVNAVNFVITVIQNETENVNGTNIPFLSLKLTANSNSYFLTVGTNR